MFTFTTFRLQNYKHFFIPQVFLLKKYFSLGKQVNRRLSSGHTVVLAAPIALGCFAYFVGFVIID
jgi:hypothetical protein